MKVQTSELFIELTFDTCHSASNVRPFLQEQLDKHLGFRSVYMFNKETYNYIQEKNAVRSLSKFPVYSDMLFVDFDDGDKSIETFKKVMNTSGIGWEMYFSGRKGYHFHVPIEPMYGVYVPFSQKQFILGLGIETADTSIYKHTGLFRTAGTYHNVTGNPKELVDKQDGNVLRLPYIEPEEELEVVEGNTASLAAALTNAHYGVVDEPSPGSRHNQLLAIAKYLAAAGATMDTALDICTLVHNTWENQYENPEEAIYDAVQRAYKWQSTGD